MEVQLTLSCSLQNKIWWMKQNKILFAYGMGSIKKNGIYEQVKNALIHKDVFEFEGIESNPDYDTLMEAVKICRKNKVDFILVKNFWNKLIQYSINLEKKIVK